jgi:hypothetical protein
MMSSATLFHTQRRRQRAIALAALALLLVAPVVVSAGGQAHRARPHAPQRIAAVGEPIVLYDGALGSTPDAQGFDFQALPPGGATQTFSSGVTTLTTTQSVSAGYFVELTPQIALDRARGYTLSFTAQVAAESHSNNDRSGFSLIVISSDKKGIELGFWTDQIWAQADGIEPPGSEIFTHAEGAPFDTTAGLIAYQLAVEGDIYSLSANGAPLLSGPIRDYSAFTPPPPIPDVYEIPNFLFLGDDSTTSSTTARLSYVAAAANATRLYLPLVVR